MRGQVRVFLGCKFQQAQAGRICVLALRRVCRICIGSLFAAFNTRRGRTHTGANTCWALWPKTRGSSEGEGQQLEGIHLYDFCMLHPPKGGMRVAVDERDPCNVMKSPLIGPKASSRHSSTSGTRCGRKPRHGAYRSQCCKQRSTTLILT